MISTLALCAAMAAPVQHWPAQQNVIIILLDDAGYGDFGFTGNPTIKTPHIDRLAHEGMIMSHFYSGSPVCTPSRYALLTGRDPRRSGLDEGHVLQPYMRKYLHPKETTIAELLKKNGYTTKIVGKWHLGAPNEKNDYTSDSLPLAHGFDEYYGLPYSNDMIPPIRRDMPLLRGPAAGDDDRYKGYEVVAWNPDQTKLREQYRDESIAFIRKSRSNRFFLYLAFVMPHIPLFPGEKFAGGSSRGAYGDVIEEIDWVVGSIANEVRRLELTDRTTIIFTSDNGPWLEYKEKGGSAGPFRYGKGTTWEGGQRVPGIIWGRGNYGGSKNILPRSFVDIFRTVARLASAEVPDDLILDGDVIDQYGQNPSFFFVDKGGEVFAVRQGRWKLKVKSRKNASPKEFEGKYPLLFDLYEDSGEKRSKAEQHPKVVERLLKLIEEKDRQIKQDGTYWDKEKAKR